MSRLSSLNQEKDIVIIIQDANVGLRHTSYSADEQWQCVINENDPVSFIVTKLLQQLYCKVDDSCFLPNVRVKREIEIVQQRFGVRICYIRTVFYREEASERRIIGHWKIVGTEEFLLALLCNYDVEAVELVLGPVVSGLCISYQIGHVYS